MKNKEIVLLDLFSGIGGFPKGLSKAGFTFKKHYFSEIDKYAIANYRYNFKTSICLGAIENIKKGKIEKPNVVTFGSPCQDLSIAGKRKGIKGKKSRLFFEAIRVIDELKPGIFIFENVRGLFSSNKGKDFEIVLRSFTELGIYDIQWQLLNTSWFLPQNRERVYVVGTVRTQPRPQVFPIGENHQTNPGESKNIEKANIAPTIDTKVGESAHFSPYIIMLRGTKKNKGQNVTFKKDKSSSCIKGHDKGHLLGGRKWYPLRSIKKAKALQRKKQENGKNYLPFDEKQYIVRPGGKMATITSNPNHGNFLAYITAIRKLTPLECERLQGFPDGWTSKGIFEGEPREISDSRRYHLLGNAVSVPVVREVGKNIIGDTKYEVGFLNGLLESPLEGINKTPISYYGGKQTMAGLILSLIPNHKLYCEPFVGGGAVFFAKEKSRKEVINDLKEDVANFYRVCKTDFNLLNRLIQSTPHSRMVHREARYILKHVDKYDQLERAWAFWVQTTMSFGSVIFGGYAYERHRNGTLKKFINKKLKFTPAISERLKGVHIECRDALRVVKSRDAKDAFFYLDPPYFNSDMAFYKGYTEKDFVNLLKLLEKIKGKFLLSSYPSGVLEKYSKKNHWFTHWVSKKIAVTYQTDKVKTEVLTANYDILKILENHRKEPGRTSLTGTGISYLHIRARALKLGLQLQ